MLHQGLTFKESSGQLYTSVQAGTLALNSSVKTLRWSLPVVGPDDTTTHCQSSRSMCVRKNATYTCTFRQCDYSPNRTKFNHQYFIQQLNFNRQTLNAKCGTCSNMTTSKYSLGHINIQHFVELVSIAAVRQWPSLQTQPPLQVPAVQESGW